MRGRISESKLQVIDNIIQSRCFLCVFQELFDNLQWQFRARKIFRIRKIFRTQGFTGFTLI